MKTRRRTPAPRPRGVAPRARRADQLAAALEAQRELTREQAERWLDLNDRYSAMYEHAPVGYVTLDVKGFVVRANQTTAELIGVPRTLLEGKPMVSFVERDDVGLFMAHIRQYANRVVATSELRLRNARGEPRLVQLTSRLGPSSTRDERTAETTITDLAERRRSERALRASEKRHREIVETANEGIAVVDAENRITFANRRLANMLRTDVETLIGTSAYDLLPPADVPAAERAFDHRDTGPAGQQDVCLRRPDGSTIWVTVSSTIMRDDHGAFAGMLRMYTDITARRLLGESRDALVRQLVEAQEQERTRIARELHDQLGQHVVALSLGLTQLGELTRGRAEVTHIVERLRGVSDLLIRDVQTLARELRPAALDHLGLRVALSDYVAQVAERTALEIDLHVDPLDGLALPPAVETALYRIVQESLTNVIKHAAARHVSVILEHGDACLQLIVEDDGAGFRIDRSPTVPRRTLGLAGMEERATLVGASFHIESTPGQGTSVYVRVPVSAGEGN